MPGNEALWTNVVGFSGAICEISFTLYLLIKRIKTTRTNEDLISGKTAIHAMVDLGLNRWHKPNTDRRHLPTNYQGRAIWKQAHVGSGTDYIFTLYDRFSGIF
jgi:hypothetical protein